MKSDIHIKKGGYHNSGVFYDDFSRTNTDCGLVPLSPSVQRLYTVKEMADEAGVDTDTINNAINTLFIRSTSDNSTITYSDYFEKVNKGKKGRPSKALTDEQVKMVQMSVNSCKFSS